jgi:hypothetical protein
MIKLNNLANREERPGALMCILRIPSGPGEEKFLILLIRDSTSFGVKGGKL